MAVSRVGARPISYIHVALDVFSTQRYRTRDPSGASRGLARARQLWQSGIVRSRRVEMSRYRRGGALVPGLGVLVLAAGLASGIVAVAASSPKPSIDDVLGVWRITFSEKNYDLVTGEKSQHKSKATITITKVGDETVDLEYQWDTGGVSHDTAYYSAGVLVAGGANDPDFADWAGTWYAEIGGKPSKWKLQGPYVSYNLTNGFTEVGTMSAKYSAP
jgi:hypothetical protein